MLDAVGDTALDDLPDVVSAHAKSVGFCEVRIYIGDVERRAVHLLAGRTTSASADVVIPIRDTTAGRAYQYGEVLADHTPSSGAGFPYWVPLFQRHGTPRADAGGEHRAGRPAGSDARLLAKLVAMAIVVKRDHNDTYARLNRTRTMNVATEALWRLMPPRTYRDSQVTLTATLEPAYKIGGDAYDYSVDGPLVHLSVFDAMGHDTAAGQAAALALAAARNARHRGRGSPRRGTPSSASCCASSAGPASSPRSLPRSTPAPARWRGPASGTTRC